MKRCIAALLIGLLWMGVALAADVQVDLTWTPPAFFTGGDPIPAGSLDHRVQMWINDQSGLGAPDLDYTTGSSAGASSTVVQAQEGDTLTFAVIAISASGFESARSNLESMPVPQVTPQAPTQIQIQLQVIAP